MAKSFTRAQIRFLQKVADAGNDGVLPVGAEWATDAELRRRRCIAKVVVPHLGVSLGLRSITLLGARVLAAHRVAP